MSTWRFTLGPSSSPATVYADITEYASEKKLSVGLNRPGEFTCSLPIAWRPSYWVSPLATCITVWYGTTAVWSGPVWTLDESLPANTLRLKAVGWFEILNYRVLLLPPLTLAAPTITNPSGTTDDAGWFNLPTGGTGAGSSTNVSRTTSSPQSGSGAIRFSDGPADPPEPLTPETVPSEPMEILLFGVFDSGTFKKGSSYRMTFYARAPSSSPVYVEVFFGQNPYQDTDYAHKRIELTSSWVQHSIEWIPLEDRLANTNSTWTTDVSLGFGRGKDLIGGDWDNGLRYGRANPFDVDTVAISVTHPERQRLIFENVPAGDIVDGLLDEINASSPSGITLPAPNIDVAPSWNRTYSKYDKVGQMIQELAATENGFDWTIDPITKEMSIHYKVGPPSGYGEVRSAAVFGYRVFPNNVRQLRRTIDAEIANYVITRGKYGSAASIDAGSVSTYGQFEEVISLSDVADMDIVKAYSAAEVAVRSEPRQRFEFLPRHELAGSDQGVPTVYTDYWLGDIVYLSANYGRLNIQGQAVRVYGIDITYDQNGNATVERIQTSYE